MINQIENPDVEGNFYDDTDVNEEGFVGEHHIIEKRAADPTKNSGASVSNKKIVQKSSDSDITNKEQPGSTMYL